MTGRQTLFLMAISVLLTGARCSEGPHERLAEGNQLLLDRQYRQAIQVYQAADETHPDQPTIHFAWAAAHFHTGEMEKATLHYKQALLTDDPVLQAEATYNLGTVRFQQAINAMRTFRNPSPHLHAAIDHYRDSLSLDPDFAAARYNMEAAHAFLQSLLAQNLVIVENPRIQNRQSATSQGRAVDSAGPRSKGRDRRMRRQQRRPTGVAGRQTGGGAPSKQQAGQVPDAATPRDMSPEDANRLVELVRDKARTVRDQRQQWQRARMGPAGDAGKSW